MKAFGTHTIGLQFVRFLVVGGLKTLATGLAFYALAAVLPPTVAFSVVYVVGLAIVALVTPRFVFGIRAERVRVALLLGWYVVIYFIGIAVVALLDSVSDSRAVLTVGTICVTAPLGFAGARILLWHRHAEARPQAS